MAMIGSGGVGYSRDMNQIYAEPTPDNGLLRLANQISEAGARVEVIAGNLNSVALGIHGPRPEPVNSPAGANAQAGDNLSSRVDALMHAIDRLQRSYESIVR